MSKKKPKTKENKIAKKHDFTHLTRTKTAAKIVEASVQNDTESSVSPLNREVTRDVKMTLILLGSFVLVILALWLLLGRNDEIFKLYDKIRFF